jgi:aspartate/methionine/tyrosine aminotransferase
MQLHPFQLERYFARYEFNAPYILSASDCESIQQKELLALADPEARGLWENLSLGYTESAGHPLLRAEIAGLYDTLAPEEILVLAPEEGIFIAMHTLLEPGDEIVAISPAYQSLHEIARSLGCKVIPWTFQPAAGGWHLETEALKELLTPRTRLLVINFPHNPTGFLPLRSELEAILSLADRHGLYVFSDEMYRLLEYEPKSRLPPVSDLYERGISLSGMSKTFALPGLRIGWLASHAPGLFEHWVTFKDYTTICSSAPSEILALIGLRAKAEIISRNLEIIRTNLSQAEHFFNRYQDLFSWIVPQAGSIAFPEWTGSGSIEKFCQELLDHQGVMIVPGSLFEFPGQRFRIGLGRRSFAAGLQRLEVYLKDLRSTASLPIS